MEKYIKIPTEKCNTIDDLQKGNNEINIITTNYGYGVVPVSVVSIFPETFTWVKEADYVYLDIADFPISDIPKIV